MPGFIRKCREGEAFRVGESTIRVLRTGRKVLISISAPPGVQIKHIASRQPEPIGDSSLEEIDTETIDAPERY